MKVELPHGYWNPRIELLPRSDLKELQLKRLRHTIRYAWENSPFYRNLMKRHGLSPEDIRTLDDFFKRFPITRRKDLDQDQLDNPPYGTRLAIPPESALRYHTTSGTTGKPNALAIERGWTELGDWSLLAARLWGSYAACDQAQGCEDTHEFQRHLPGHLRVLR